MGKKRRKVKDGEEESSGLHFLYSEAVAKVLRKYGCGCVTGGLVRSRYPSSYLYRDNTQLGLQHLPNLEESYPGIPSPIGTPPTLVPAQTENDADPDSQTAGSAKTTATTTDVVRSIPPPSPPAPVKRSTTFYLPHINPNVRFPTRGGTEEIPARWTAGGNKKVSSAPRDEDPLMAGSVTEGLKLTRARTVVGEMGQSRGFPSVNMVNRTKTSESASNLRSKDTATSSSGYPRRTTNKADVYANFERPKVSTNHRQYGLSRDRRDADSGTTFLTERRSAYYPRRLPSALGTPPPSTYSNRAILEKMWSERIPLCRNN